jgi:hypothetical protein
MATKKPVTTSKGKMAGTPVPLPKRKPAPSKTLTPRPKKTLPTLAEYKTSAAYKTGSMTYKEYLDYFKSQGYK